MADTGIRALIVREHQRHDRFDCVDIFDVLTHLGEGHDGGILVAPVLVGHHLLDQHTEGRQHDLLTDGAHQTVHGLDAETHFVSIDFTVLMGI